jgi:hypothetical protein
MIPLTRELVPTIALATSTSTGRAVRRKLAALCTSTGAGPGEEIAIIDAGTAAAATSEGLAPLLGARLDTGALAASTAEIHADLTRAYHACLGWTLFANAAIREMVAGFRGAGIPVVALKGSALIRTVMRPGQRPMVDIDLLVPAARWPEARRIASAAGATVWDPLDRPITAAHDYALPMRTREGLLVELHRYLCERPLFRPQYDGPDGIFARAILTEDGLRVPDPTDLFLGLAIHAAHHAYHLPFRAIVDGLILGGSPGLLLSSVAERARLWRAKTATAAFLLVLAGFGFVHPDLSAALRELRYPKGLPALLAAAPWSERDAHREDWRRRWRVARLLDGAPTRIAYFGQRLGLRVADTLWNRYIKK